METKVKYLIDFINEPIPSGEGFRSYAVWIPFNPLGDILLQRKDAGHWIWPNYWCTFGGGEKNGEGIYETVKREGENEFGKKIKLLGELKFLGAQKFKEKRGDHQRDSNVNYFVVPFDGDLSHLEIKEGAGFSVFNRETIARYNEFGLVVPPNYEAIKRFYEGFQSGKFKI